MTSNEQKQTWTVSAAVFLVNLLSLLCLAASGHAQVEIVHDFLRLGINPRGVLIQGSDGFLYGTTSLGGAASSGTVFKTATDGSGFTVLKSFNCGMATDGCDPEAGLIQGSDGFLYGTTFSGGASNGGTVFRNRDRRQWVHHIELLSMWIPLKQRL